MYTRILRTLIVVFLFLNAFFIHKILNISIAVHAQNACIMGDANGDGKVNLTDFEVWRRAFLAGSVTQPPGPTDTPTPSGNGKVKLLLHDWPGNTGGHPYPQYIRDNLSWLESQRDFLDGMMVQFPSAMDIMTNNPVGYAQLNSELSPMKNLPATKLKYNFILVYNNRPGDPFDDWSGAVQNWKDLAQAAKDNGFVGIAFDNEEYNTPWGSYKDRAYQNKSLTEYQLQTMAQGKKIMDAIVSVWPDVQMIHLHGPYISEPKSDPNVVYTLVSAGYDELFGPFFTGMMQGKGASGLMIDGGEIYRLRTPAEYNAAYDWQRNGMSSDATNSVFVPPDLRPIFRRDLNVSYGIWNDTTGLYTGQPMNSSIFGTTIHNALNRADSYVWLYIDNGTMLNIGSPQIGQDWVDAARNAKNQYLQGQ